jgi:hypothetical protein
VSTSEGHASIVVDELFKLLRTVKSFGIEHASAQSGSKQCAAVLAGVPLPTSLQFLQGVVFTERKLVAMARDEFERARWLGAQLSKCKVHEVTLEGPVLAQDWLRFAAVVAGTSALSIEELTITGLKLRELDNARLGEAKEDTDPETFAIVQMALALATADRIQLAVASEPGWPWPEGIHFVRRVERAHSAHRAASIRAIEMPDAAWTAARRATCAAFLVGLALSDLGARGTHQRAAVHATFALMLGVSRSPGTPLAACASQVLQTMSKTAVRNAGSAIEPHRLLVLALLAECAAEDKSLAAVGLIRTVVMLESERRPQGVEFDLSLVDLFAMACGDEIADLDANWLALLVRATGVLPPGARVMLADGRMGVVMGPGDAGDPFRPLVLVNGERIQTAARVSLAKTG